MSKIKHFIEQSWLLIVASFCFGLLIAITNAAWSPRIEQNKVTKINDLMGGLLPAAKSFESSAELHRDMAAAPVERLRFDIVRSSVVRG